MHACVCVRACVRACVCVHVCARKCVQEFVAACGTPPGAHAATNASMHLRAHTHTHTYTHTHTHTRTRTHARTHTHTHMQVVAGTKQATATGGKEKRRLWWLSDDSLFRTGAEQGKKDFAVWKEWLEAAEGSKANRRVVGWSSVSVLCERN